MQTWGYLLDVIDVYRIGFLTLSDTLVKIYIQKQKRLLILDAILMHIFAQITSFSGLSIELPKCHHCVL